MNDLTKIDKNTIEYLLEEQKQRRQEIDRLHARLESDQRNALLATGALWAWLITNTVSLQRELLTLVAVLPIGLIAFFYYRSWGIRKEMALVAGYTRMLEDFFAVPGNLGWERFWEARRPKRIRHGSLKGKTHGFWIALIVLNLLFAVAFIWIRK